MKKLVPILFLVCSLFLVCGPLIAQDAKVTSLMSKPLPDIPSKELLMIAVEYPPGASDPVHRHNAHAFVYVLEGTIVMGVNGENPVTRPDRRFTKAPTIFTPLVATPARRCQPSSWCSCSKTKMHLF